MGSSTWHSAARPMLESQPCWQGGRHASLSPWMFPCCAEQSAHGDEKHRWRLPTPGSLQAEPLQHCSWPGEMIGVKETYDMHYGKPDPKGNSVYSQRSRCGPSKQVCRATEVTTSQKKTHHTTRQKPKSGTT